MSFRASRSTEGIKPTRDPDLASRETWGGLNRKEVVLWNLTVVANEVVLSRTVGGLSPTATGKADVGTGSGCSAAFHPRYVRGPSGSLILEHIGTGFLREAGPSFF